MSNLTEQKIQEALKHQISQPRFLLNNLYVFGWESDVLHLTKSGYWYEFEIKITKSDFKNDFKHKTNKHLNILKNKDNTRKPNYFSYVVPENMVTVEEVPEYVGLIYVGEYGRLKTIKEAPKLHKEKVDPNTLNLLDKFYWNMKNAKIKTSETIGNMKLLEDKYSNQKDLEITANRTGYNDAMNDAFEAFRLCCSDRIEDGSPRGICSRNGFRCRGNCDELENFMTTMENMQNKKGRKN